MKDNEIVAKLRALEVRIGALEASGVPVKVDQKTEKTINDLTSKLNDLILEVEELKNTING